MMLRVIIFFVFLSANVHAQLIGINDSIMSVKGVWGKSPHVYTNKYPATLFPFAEKRVDSIARLFKQAYPNLRGADASWYASLDETPAFAGGPWAYAFRCSFKYYYYNTAYRKIMKSDETGTWGYALVNRVAWCLEAQDFMIEINGKKKTAWRFPREIGNWKGYTLYEPVAHGKGSSAVILTRSGSVPWKPITQLQYLQALRKKHEAERSSTLAAAATDAYKKKFSEFWDKELKVIDDYISNNTQATLNQQAIVNNWRIFRGSFPTIENDKNAYKLVYIDQSYFNASLPAYIPQFIVLYWRWNNNAPGLYFKEQIENNFPVEKLQAMISQN